MQTLTEVPCPLEEGTLNRVGQTSKIVPQNVLPPQDLTSNEQSLHNTLAHQRRLPCGDGSESPGADATGPSGVLVSLGPPALGRERIEVPTDVGTGMSLL